MPGPRPSLTVAALHDFVRENCFSPSDRGLVGVEIEALTFPSGDPEQRPSAAELHQAVKTAETTAGSKVTFEPGGQVEVSTRPHPVLTDALAAADADFVAVSAALRRAGIETVAVGFDPIRPPRRILDRPRYVAMEAFFDADGIAGRTMMCATAALQVNIDLGDADSVSARWRRAHTAGPVLAACFANARSDGLGHRPRSVRQQVWAAIDPSRTSPVHDPDGPAAGPADEWLAYAVAARVMLVRASDDRFEPVLSPMTFGQWMVRGHPLGYPTLDDFAYHLTTLFPPVRPRGWLELRVLDTLPDPWWRVAVAVVAAVLTDPAPVEAADPHLPAGRGLWVEAAEYGLAHPILGSAARRMFVAALAALPAVGADAATVADAEVFFERFVAPGRSPAGEFPGVPSGALADGRRPGIAKGASLA